MSWRHRKTPEEAESYGDKRGYRRAVVELRLLLQAHPDETGRELLERILRGEHRIERRHPAERREP